MTVDNFFAEMDLIADGLCAGSTFVDDLKFEFRQLQKCYYPNLTGGEWHRLFWRWRAHYRDRERVILVAGNFNRFPLWVNVLRQFNEHPTAEFRRMLFIHRDPGHALDRVARKSLER